MFYIDTECKWDYSSNVDYKTKFEKLCNGKYDYKCDQDLLIGRYCSFSVKPKIFDLCALNKESCELFNRKFQVLGLMHFSFKEKIKNCPVNSHKIRKDDWKKVEAIKKLFCFKQKIQSLSM